jgi:signal transduction histidine kinase
MTTLAVSTALLLTAVAVGVAITANTNSDQINNVFNQVGPVRTDGDLLLVALLNQETGLRGYALGGTAADLQPYTDGVASQNSLTSQMMPLLSAMPGVAADLREVGARMDTWRANVAEPVIARVAAGDMDGARATLDTSAKAEFDAVRAAAAKLQVDVLAVRNTAVTRLQQSSRDIIWELIAGAVVVIIGGLLLAFLLRRFVTAPLNRLASSVRLVADGDFNHVIDTTGPPELARLGRDVDNMRQRIVDDLRVVQRARDVVAEANATLEQHAAELTRSNEDLEQFAYVASHDLQEPLRKVASFCQLLQRRYAGKLDERADQYIAFAVDGAHRMQRLINDLLRFSRIGRVTAEFTEVDLNDVVASAAEASRSTVDATGGAITWSDLPVIPGETPLLSALFTNLISNSVKFRTAGVPVRIDVSARAVGTSWEITCRDNGIGIEAEYVDKIFVIFQRLHARDAYPGTGIGLAIAKRIVEYHGGRIWVDTSAEQGTAILFTLPMEAPTGASQDVNALIATLPAVG